MAYPPIAGVRFRNAGRISYVHTAGMRLETGEYVVCETTRGPEIAKVVIAPDQVVVNELNEDDLKPILRLATDEDLRRADAMKTKAEEVLPEARRLAESAGFPAHIDAAEFTLDGKRLTLSFSSEQRIDYRDFLRKASDRFNARVEMRQIGDRDRAKLAGGYGICGRELCCANWLTSFPSISIRMAKEQDLPLNPQKISGLCGRLLCCLSYEEDGYREMRRSLPKIGQRCSTPTGEAKAINVNILRRQVTLLMPDGQRVDVGDRDLGTVVRWDTTSKAAEPPPSISRADAIAQGMIEADDIDRGIEIEEAPFERPGRGRLPAPRRLPQPRPPQPEGAAPPQGREGRGGNPPNQVRRGRGGSGGSAGPGAPPPQENQPRGRDGRPPRGDGQPVRGDANPARDGQPRGQRPQPPRPPRATPIEPPGGVSRVFRRSGQPPAEGEAPARPAPPPRAPSPPPPSRPTAAENAAGTNEQQAEAARRRRRRGTRGGKGGRSEGGDGGDASGSNPGFGADSE